jgi:bifunctional DNase/RNase
MVANMAVSTPSPFIHMVVAAMRRESMQRRGGVVCALALIGAMLAVVPRAQPATEAMVEVRVRGVTVDPQGASPVVLLEEAQGARLMPIWVGVFEARAIAMELEKIVPPRPMTHDLIKNLLGSLKAEVTNVAITALKDNTFYAQIAVAMGAERVHIDARPSDAIAVALRVNAPIFVAKAVFDSAPAIDLREAEPTPITVLKRYGLTLQNVTAPLAAHFRLPSPEGVLVSDVEAGSAAEQDGLRRGDIIVGANQAKIADLQAFESTLSQGGDIALQIVRADKRLTLVLHKLMP